MSARKRKAAGLHYLDDVDPEETAMLALLEELCQNILDVNAVKGHDGRSRDVSSVQG